MMRGVWSHRCSTSGRRFTRSVNATRAFAAKRTSSSCGRSTHDSVVGRAARLRAGAPGRDRRPGEGGLRRARLDRLLRVGIRQSEDFGEIVFALVGEGLLGRQPDDSIHDFTGGIDLRSELEPPPFKGNRRPEAGRRPRAAPRLPVRVPRSRMHHPQDPLAYHAEGRPGRSRSSRRSPSPPSTTSRSPTRPGSPSRAARSPPIPSAYDYTAKGNLVAVVTNGTAVLGLGAIGPLAGKPVMEGRPSCSRSSRTSTCSTSRSTHPTLRSS